MAYNSGVLITDSGYEGYVDRSETIVSIATELFSKYSSDFNPGQLVILKNTRITADVQQYWTRDYYGEDHIDTSSIEHYYLNIDCPHEEAISETIERVTEETEQYANQLLNSEYDNFSVDEKNFIWDQIVREIFGYAKYI